MVFSKIMGAAKRILRGSVSKTERLGSGYDVERERKHRAEVRRLLLEQIVKSPRYQSHVVAGALRTFCNQAVQEDAMHSGCFVLEGLLANDMISKAIAHPDFTIEPDVARVVKHVRRGGFAFAGKVYEPHGHVASIYPSDALYSGSLQKMVPLVAHVGKIGTNGIKRASEAFPVKEGEPLYFLWMVGNV